METTQLDSAGLTIPPDLVSISEPSFTKAATSIILRCPDNLFTKCTVFDSAGAILFTIESPGLWSYSWRRIVKDASGRHVFTLRRRYFMIFYAYKWIVEGPNGEKLGQVLHNITFWNIKRSSLNMRLRNTSMGDQDDDKKTVVQMRHVDIMAKKTIVKIDGVTVADIVALENNDFTSWMTGEVRGVWKARVAGGVDLDIVLLAMLCRAEQRHLWWQ